MATPKNLTKAELLARIDQMEAEAAAFERQREALIQQSSAYEFERDEARRERDALQQRVNHAVVAYRELRTSHSRSHDFAPTVMLGGKPHLRVTAMEYGRKVVTYKPLSH